MQNKVKVVLVGPPETGKTMLANFLSEAAEIGSGEYRPTKGCRIIEFEVPNVSLNGMTTKAEVELWDVSGDRSYENCWPAIQKGMNGVIFVYNPGRDDQAQALESLHSHFAEQQGVRETQCIVFCHHKPGSKGKGSKLGNVFNPVPKIDTHIEEDGGGVRRDFSNFIGSVLAHMSAVAERQENFILQ